MDTDTLAAWTAIGQHLARLADEGVNVGLYWHPDVDSGNGDGWAPTSAPVRVEVEAMAARPKRLVPRAAGGSWPNSRPLERGPMWRCTKPDADNVAKAVLDALVKAGVLRDDVQVVELVVRSLYAPVDGAPLVAVAVERVDGGGP